MHILYENLANSLISEETFEIMTENISCCVWCTVPALQYLYSLPVVFYVTKG